MKKKFLIILCFISCFAYSQSWEKNYAIAKSKAEDSKNTLMLVFAGSDWCAPCIKLDRLVFQSQEFQNYAKDNLILYKADFPRKKVNSLAPELVQVNNSLAEKFNPNGYFPLVIVLNNDEKVLGSFGYENKPIEEYISLLNSIVE